MDEAIKPIASLADLELDAENANLGTDRGKWAIQESVVRFGVGRGIVVDRRGRIIGGNKTTEVLHSLNPGVRVVVVPSEGDTLVVTQRVDLDLANDAAARELAFADNRVGELDLAWDAQKITQAMEEGLDLAVFFHKDEIQRLLADAELEANGKGKRSEDDPTPAMEIMPFEHYDYVMIVFRNSWDWARAVDFFNIEPRAFVFEDSHKKQHRKIGLCRVIDGAAFFQKVEACKSAASS